MAIISSIFNQMVRRFYIIPNKYKVLDIDSSWYRSHNGARIMDHCNWTEWLWLILSDCDLYWVTVTYTEWPWPTLSDCDLCWVTVTYAEWLCDRYKPDEVSSTTQQADNKQVGHHTQQHEGTHHTTWSLLRVHVILNHILL